MAAQKVMPEPSEGRSLLVVMRGDDDPQPMEVKLTADVLGAIETGQYVTTEKNPANYVLGCWLQFMDRDPVHRFITVRLAADTTHYYVAEKVVSPPRPGALYGDVSIVVREVDEMTGPNLLAQRDPVGDRADAVTMPFMRDPAGTRVATAETERPIAPERTAEWTDSQNAPTPEPVVATPDTPDRTPVTVTAPINEPDDGQPSFDEVESEPMTKVDDPVAHADLPQPAEWGDQPTQVETQPQPEPEPVVEEPAEPVAVVDDDATSNLPPLQPEPEPLPLPADEEPAADEPESAPAETVAAGPTEEPEPPIPTVEVPVAKTEVKDDPAVVAEVPEEPPAAPARPPIKLYSGAAKPASELGHLLLGQRVYMRSINGNKHEVGPNGSKLAGIPIPKDAFRMEGIDLKPGLYRLVVEWHGPATPIDRTYFGTHEIEVRLTAGRTTTIGGTRDRDGAYGWQAVATSTPRETSDLR